MGLFCMSLCIQMGLFCMSPCIHITEFHMIKDRTKLRNYVYQYQGYFFQIYCICIFQTHTLSCFGTKFLVSGVCCVFWELLLFLSSFQPTRLADRAIDVIAQKNERFT